MRDKETNMALINELKTACNRCGVTDKGILLFHHINPSLKEANIGPHLTADRILKEAGKCEILCFNCHIAHHRKYPVKGTKKPLTKSKELSLLGANIARGKNLRASLGQLDRGLLVEIRKQINLILQPISPPIEPSPTEAPVEKTVQIVQVENTLIPTFTRF